MSIAEMATFGLLTRTRKTAHLISSLGSEIACFGYKDMETARIHFRPKEPYLHFALIST